MNKFELFEFKKFVKNMNEQFNIYIFAVVDVNSTKEQSKSMEILKDYLYSKNLFDNEKAKILSQQSQKIYVINLMKNINRYVCH